LALSNQNEYGLERGGSVLVEVEDCGSTGPRPAAVGGAVIERASVSLEQALKAVKPFAESLIEQFSELSRKPDSVTLEFGIKLAAGADALIAKTAVEGTCKVTLQWASHPQ
jgi:hypothetical protein